MLGPGGRQKKQNFRNSGAAALEHIHTFKKREIAKSGSAKNPNETKTLTLWNLCPRAAAGPPDLRTRSPPNSRPCLPRLGDFGHGRPPARGQAWNSHAPPAAARAVPGLGVIIYPASKAKWVDSSRFQGPGSGSSECAPSVNERAIVTAPSDQQPLKRVAESLRTDWRRSPGLRACLRWTRGTAPAGACRRPVRARSLFRGLRKDI